MNIIQLLQTCFRSILRNRMRSLLTSLGVIIGVGSVIIMVALGQGSQKAIEESINSMGTNLLQIRYRRVRSRPGSGFVTQMRISGFRKNDIAKIENESSFVAAISGLTQSSQTVTGGQSSSDVSIQGVEPGYLVARSWVVAEGYFIADEDLENRSRVAVLGNTTAETLFGDAAAALNQQIRVGTVYFTVIGVLEPKGGGMGGDDQDEVVMVPLDTAMTRLNNSRTVNTIVISVVDQQYMEAAQKEIELILREARNIADGAESDFSIMNQAEIMDMASSTSRTLTTLLASIAGVSLLVGGIGIMNIMLVSVTERTREIGIRMAVGGRKRDILLQFLSESVILSLMGGLLGIGLAFLSCRILTMIGVPTSINPFIVSGSALFAAFIGIIFGYYPALKAARLYPIDALRYE